MVTVAVVVTVVDHTVSGVGNTATVRFGSDLRRHTGGLAEVEAEGANVTELITNLTSKFPELEPRLRAGTAVVINGVLIAHPDYEPVPDGAEVYFVPQPSGG